jgi:hypothetical protein
MGQVQCRLVCHVKLPTQLQSTDPLLAVGDNHDRSQNVPNRKLVVGEDRPAGDREPVAAVLAFPAVLRSADVEPYATTPRALRLFDGITRRRVTWVAEADEPTVMNAPRGAMVIEKIVEDPNGPMA